MNAVVIGPGRIGCGYLAPLLLGAGWAVTLACRTAEAAATVRRSGRYQVRVTQCTGESPDGDGFGPGTLHAVEGFSAVSVGSRRFEERVADADLVCVAIRSSNLSDIAGPLAVACARRRRKPPLAIWVIENDHHGSDLGPALLRAAAELGQPLAPVTLARAVAHPVVGRGSWHAPETPEFVSDAWRTMVVERVSPASDTYGLPGVTLTDDFAARLREKLWGFNSGHAVAAYVGWLLGHTTVDRAVSDPWVRYVVTGCLVAVRLALVTAYPALGTEVDGPVKETLRRFGDSALADPVVRVARDPIRKLAPVDRLLGPVGLVTRVTGEPPEAFVPAVAAALMYSEPSDPQALVLHDRVTRRGVPAVLRDICGLDVIDPFALAVAARCRAYEEEGPEAFFPPSVREIDLTDAPERAARPA